MGKPTKNSCRAVNEQLELMTTAETEASAKKVRAGMVWGGDGCFENGISTYGDFLKDCWTYFEHTLNSINFVYLKTQTYIYIYICLHTHTNVYIYILHAFCYMIMYCVYIYIYSLVYCFSYTHMQIEYKAQVSYSNFRHQPRRASKARCRKEPWLGEAIGHSRMSLWMISRWPGWVKDLLKNSQNHG